LAVAGLILVRHAESEANASSVWQGRAESSLSERGKGQAARLGGRFRGNFDLVVSSPLSRAVETAKAVSEDVVVDERLIEIDLGRWDGLSFAEMGERYQLELAEVDRRGDLRFGETGETFGELSERAWAAVESLLDRLGDDGTALVVTHGGVLDALISRFFPRKQGGRTYAFPGNASASRMVRRYGRTRLASFNDVAHLNEPDRKSEVAVMTLIRHGRTRANFEGRWQGHSGRGLDHVGQRQAEALAAWYGRLDLVFTSPLDRARETARHLALREPIVVDDLRELGFGLWEGLTTPEIEGGWPDLFHQIFLEGLDLPRGETGETWEQMTARVCRAIENLARPDRGRFAVVTHGGSIRAYMTFIGGGSWAMAGGFETTPNTGVSHIAFKETGPFLLDYGVAPHLESLEP
jgi:broad specificity phosphatase PhoE